MALPVLEKSCFPHFIAAPMALYRILMKHLPRTLTMAALTSLAAACSSGLTSNVAPAIRSDKVVAATRAVAVQSANSQERYFHACTELLHDNVLYCDALVRTDINSSIIEQASIHTGFTSGGDAVPSREGPFTGLTPEDLRRAYNVPASGGIGKTIGIVDAQDDPLAESDLAKYRAHFKLPPCTSANGCFRKLNQAGVAKSYPSESVAWTYEISLDLDMASAICPTCHILLIEATTATFDNLGAAVDMAVQQGADVVSNSYGGPEFSAYNKHYDHKGVLIVASTGDNGYFVGPAQPASYATVLAVGGTTLVASRGGRGFTETAWPGAGAGCSKFVEKPSWQHNLGCAGRMEADISAVADPASGVRVSDGFGTGGKWLIVGGTSVSTPIIASLYALTRQGSAQDVARSIWESKGDHLFDITSGSDGECSPSYECTAGPGYDGPTGWGSPNGISGL